MEAGFAKLQGEDFQYFMRTYSIILGRNSKKVKVDLDISTLGGGTDFSRRHARIFYDFERHGFFLEVLGQTGCVVKGVLHLPDGGPVKLESQDLLQIGQKKFYFLLPTRSIFATIAAQRAHIATAAAQHTRTATTAGQHGHIATASGHHTHTATTAQHAHTATRAAHHAQIATAAAHHAHTSISAGQHAHTTTAVAHHAHTATTAVYPSSSDFSERSCGNNDIQAASKYTHIASEPSSSSFVWSGYPHSSGFSEHSFGKNYIGDNGENEIRVRTETQGKFMKQSKMSSDELGAYSKHCVTVEPTVTLGGERVGKLATRTPDKVRKDKESQKVLLKEEKDVVAAIATLISDLCGPGEWTPMEKLHSELIERFSTIWPHRRVQMYLTPEDGSSSETENWPWSNLLKLLRKYPEHFVINVFCRGQVTSVTVSLASLVF